MLHKIMDNAAIISDTINLFVLPKTISRTPSQNGLSKYFSIDFKKKKPETIKKKSTGTIVPSKYYESTGKKPWKYATHTAHKNLNNSIKPFFLFTAVLLKADIFLPQKFSRVDILQAIVYHSFRHKST